MTEYFSSYPFNNSSKVEKRDFDKLPLGYIVYSDKSCFDGQIIEKISNGRLNFVTFLCEHVNNPTIESIVNRKYSGISYEIESKIDAYSSIVFRKNSGANDAIIIRKYNSSNIITSEACFENGELLQYDELIYDSNNNLLETKTFIGKNAWVIEKHLT